MHRVRVLHRGPVPRLRFLQTRLQSRFYRRFDAAEFADTLERYGTKTAQTFTGVPLAEDATLTRARVLKAVARRLDAELHPGATIADAANTSGPTAATALSPVTQPGSQLSSPGKAEDTAGAASAAAAPVAAS